MKLTPQPRLVGARVGQTWLAQGFRLFHRQPLTWTLILFIYWASMLMFAFIPVFGTVIPLLLSPGLSMGFIEVARAIDARDPAAPPLLVSAFRSERAKAVLMLGLWYVVEIVAILLISTIIDGGLLVDWITVGTVPAPEDMHRIQTAAVLSSVLYVPVMMAFWFAPQLVVWSDFAPTKALFFSFFAVWRNKAAFFRYALTWIGLTLFIGAISALISQSFGLAPNTMTGLLFPVTLILMSVAHGSFYASTKDIFAEEDSARLS